MITGYFGVPRVGKNTLATKIARKALKKRVYFFGLIGPKKYDHVYTDFYCEGCCQIEFNDLKKYKMYNSLIIFEEMALDADNRAYKSFDQAVRDYLVLHGHLFNDIIYLTQDYSLVDKKIRSLTQELWYLSKSCVPFFSEFTIARRIYRCININEFTGDLIMGYRFCNFLERFFTSNIQICFRRPYYKYFDSHDEGILQTRPVFDSIEWKSSKFDLSEKEQILLRLNNLHGQKRAMASSVSYDEERESLNNSPKPRGATYLQNTFNKLKQKIK